MSWVIAGEPDGKVPVIGHIYEIRDQRKGTFIGEIEEIKGNFAIVKVLKGKINWASRENRTFNSNPNKVSVRNTLAYFIKLESK